MQYIKTINGVDYYQHEKKLFQRLTNGALVELNGFQESVVKNRDGIIKEDPPDSWYWDNPSKWIGIE